MVEEFLLYLHYNIWAPININGHNFLLLIFEFESFLKIISYFVQ